MNKKGRKIRKKIIKIQLVSFVFSFPFQISFLSYLSQYSILMAYNPNKSHSTTLLQNSQKISTKIKRIKELFLAKETKYNEIKFLCCTIKIYQ